MIKRPLLAALLCAGWVMLSPVVRAASPHQDALYHAIGPYSWVYPLSDYIDAAVLGGGLVVGNPITGTCPDGQILYSNLTNLGCKVVSGTGTATSVALALPGIFTVSGSPVTTSGTLTGALATQVANAVFAGPTTGAAAAPTFRALVPADLPVTAVTPGTYTATNLTVDAQGRITAASNGSAGTGLTIGTSTITGGTTTRVLFDNAGVAGEYSISGTGNVAMTTSPIFVTPALGTPASGVGTNLTGTAAGLTAGVATLANGLKSATTTIVVSAATAPTAGQVLTALSGTAADWETLSASATSITPGTTTIVGATSPCAIVNTTSTVMGCLAYGATGNSTLVQTTGGGLLNPAVLPLATSAAFGAVKVDNQTIVAAAGVISAAAPSRTATTPTVATTDMGGTIWATGTITIPAITTNLFDAKQTLLLVNVSGSTETVTSSPTVNAGGNCVTASGIPAGYAWQIQSNNTTLDCQQIASSVAISQVTGLGTNVPTAAAVTLSAAGGLSTTVGSGTAALGTSAISSAACASAVVVSIPNTATTDVISWGFNGDPTGVTGYVPLVAGMLTIIAYPTSGNANFKVCNNTNASVTPGAITLNVRVIR